MKTWTICIGAALHQAPQLFHEEKKLKKKYIYIHTQKPSMRWRVGGWTLQGFPTSIKTWQFSTSHSSTQSLESQRQLKVYRHLSFQQLNSSGGPEPCISYPRYLYKSNQYLRMCSMYVPFWFMKYGWYMCSKGLCICTKYNTYQHDLFKKICNGGEGPVL